MIFHDKAALGLSALLCFYAVNAIAQAQHKILNQRKKP
jgi:hypothetical protein